MSENPGKRRVTVELTGERVQPLAVRFTQLMQIMNVDEQIELHVVMAAAMFATGATMSMGGWALDAQSSLGKELAPFLHGYLAAERQRKAKGN